MNIDTRNALVDLFDDVVAAAWRRGESRPTLEFKPISSPGLAATYTVQTRAIVIDPHRIERAGIDAEHVLMHELAHARLGTEGGGINPHGWRFQRVLGELYAAIGVQIDAAGHGYERANYIAQHGERWMRLEAWLEHGRRGPIFESVLPWVQFGAVVGLAVGVINQFGGIL